MSKKILFVNSSLTAGGSERVMTLIANEFAKRNYDITMVLLREINKDTYELNKKIKCIRFKYGTKNKIVIAIKRICKLRKIIKTGNYDSIISFMHDINTVTLISALNISVPIIISERADPNSREINYLLKKFEDIMYKKAHKIVFQTEQVKKMYSKEIQDIGVVIPNPVNKNIPRPFNGKREKNIIGVGRLTEQKNFPMMINAFSKFHKKYPEYKLVIYGEGYLRTKLESQIKELKLEKNVLLPGYINNVNAKMLNASMYVSSSNYEGISNSMIEALAMGIPTICTDCPVGGASMMIKNNINGVLIPVGDEDALYKSMLKLTNDKEFAERIGTAAKSIRKKYSIEKIVNEWEKIIE